MINYISTSFVDFFSQGLKMYPIFILIIVGCIIQFTKVVIDLIRYRRLFWDHVFSSGGFPSFHSGLASSATMMVLLTYGFNDVFLAVAFAFAILFSYDAMNLRFEAGEHARYINNLRAFVGQESVTTKKGKGKLKERIGHTPLEVAGGVIFGSVLTFVFYYWFCLV